MGTILLGYFLSVSETGYKDLGKCLPSALSPREKILVDSFETKKGKKVLYKRQKEQRGNRNSIQQIFVECLLSTRPWNQYHL